MAARVLSIMFRRNILGYQLRTQFVTREKYIESIRERILTDLLYSPTRALFTL